MIHLVYVSFDEARYSVVAFTDEVACRAAVERANELCNEIYDTETTEDAVKVWEKIFDVLPPLRNLPTDAFGKKTFGETMVGYIHFHRNHYRLYGKQNQVEVHRPNFGLFYVDPVELI